MTDQIEQTPAASDAPAAQEPTVSSRDTLAWLCGGGFVILAAAIAWLALRPPAAPESVRPEQLDALGLQIHALETRVSRLEQRPAASSTDLTPLTARLAGVEQSMASTSAQVAQLASRVSKAEQQPGTSPAELDGLTARLAALERTTSQVRALAERANRIARIQAAQVALELGQPLGEIPSAPPSLTRYATSNPPTEASLRLAFPAVAKATLAASRPDVAGKSFWQRTWAEAQSLVTVRDGDRVLIGDPAAGVLAHAQDQLDAGDLAGAIATVATLSGPAGQAMSGWVSTARGLLEARAALAALAAHA